MTNSKTLSKLELEIQTEWRSYQWVLSAGDELICGRSPDCEILVPRRSVSQEHLKIHWNGFEVFIADLGSANGTFESDGKSRFIEGTFREPSVSLQLLISKSPIKISGRHLDATRVQTIFSAPDPGEPLSADHPANQVTRTLKNLEWTRTESPAGTAPKKSRPRVVAQVKELKKLPNLSINSAHELAAWFCVFSAGFIFLIGSIGLGFLTLKGLLSLDAAVYVKGASHDLNLIWVELVRNLKGPLFVLIFSVLALGTLFLKKSENSDFLLIDFLADKFQNFPYFGVHLVKIFTFLVWFLVFTWIPIFAWFTSGLQHSPLKPEYSRFWKIVKSRGDPFSVRAEKLKGLLPQLRGSSLVFKEILVTDRALVLAECEGRGESSWEAKSLCLVLLAGKTIESLDWAKPAALARPGARAALLSALDGISRTLAVEGHKSESFNFYFSALYDIGLQPEADTLKTLIQDQTNLVDDKQKQLAALRRSTEVALLNDQLELNLPGIFRFEIPGPLESGI